MASTTSSWGPDAQRPCAAPYEVEAARLELPGADPVRVPRLRLHARAGSPALPPVRIFLGTELAQHRAERVMLWSIAHSASPDRSYEVTLLRDAPGTPRKLGWATSFSNFRFLIPLLAGGQGKVIYNDTDQVYLADPAELFDLPMGDAGYLAIEPRETSVMLLDCERMLSVWQPEDIGRLSRRRMVDAATNQPGLFGAIDPAWNKRDSDDIPVERAKVYHFTTLHTQPWRPFPERFVYHEHPEAGLWWRMRRQADAEGFQAFGRSASARDLGTERVAGSTRADFEVELRGLLGRCGADTILCVGAEPRATGARVHREGDPADSTEVHDAALWVVGREGVAPDDVPRTLIRLFERSRNLVYVRAGCRPGRAGAWWWPPVGSVGTERWWLDQLSAVAARFPDHRWELDLEDSGGRRLRPGGGAPLGGVEPRVWVLSDGDTLHDRLAGAVADAVGWRSELRPVREGRLFRSLRERLGGALWNSLLGATPRGLEGTSGGPTPDAWPALIISAGDICRPRARFLREASGHRSRVLQIDTRSASPTRDFDLVVTPPGVGALAHPRRLEGEILEGQRVQVPAGGLAGLRQAIGRRAFVRPSNDRGTTRPQLVVEGVFSRLLAEGLAIAGGHAAAGPEAAATARVDVLASVAQRARALVARTC